MSRILPPNRLQSLFIAAIEFDSTAARQQFIAQECGDDAGLRRELCELLDVHQQAGDFLGDVPGDGDDLTSVDDAGRQIIMQARLPLGSKIGPYIIGGPLGEGGFGVVYGAEQRGPVQRHVALKVIKPGMDTLEVLARFDRERQSLALMNHPSIAKVFDAGSTVSGRPITGYCERAKLNLEQRLRLFCSVCHAVQHAHQKGIRHRDTVPTVKVIDFGVAKTLEPDSDGPIEFTHLNQLIGTPCYISPEQAETPRNIDTRTDVYSLGVILYELLCGTTPFQRSRLQRADLAELRQILRDEEPPKPIRLTSRDSPAPC